MTTEYTRTLTIAVPEHYMTEANHLACLMGESAADIETFQQATYTDGTTNYAVAHTVCKQVVTDALVAMTLPPDPEHVPDTYDRTLAEEAMSAIESGDILVAADVDPHAQLGVWGLSQIQAGEML